MLVRPRSAASDSFFFAFFVVDDLFGDVAVGQDRREIPTPVGEEVGEVVEVAPVAFASQPIAQVHAEVVRQVVAQFGMEPGDVVYEAEEPPGASLAPEP